MGVAPSTSANLSTKNPKPSKQIREPLKQIRELTRTEIIIQATWLEVLDELKAKNPSEFPPHFIAPDIIFEEGNVYFPDKDYMVGVTPKMYAKLEMLFDKFVLKEFERYKLTEEFVEIKSAELWREYGKIEFYQPDKSKPNLEIKGEDAIKELIKKDKIAENKYEKILNILKNYNEQFTGYDVIIYLNLHGNITDTLEENPILEIKEDMKVKFLAYAQLGEMSFIVPELYTKIHELFNGRTGVVDIPHILNILWRMKFNTSASQKK
jgi:hypothetical protein